MTQSLSTRSPSALVRLLAGASFALMAAAAGPALAADAAATAAAPTASGAGAEGADFESVVVTAERNKAAAEAPSKASVIETQPESIISRAFIDQAVSETGGWVQAASIAPSMSGIPGNGGGVGETTKLSLRGFQDGQFNITYDGIAFGDTNGPTHHEASYWPASTIGSVVIDRGPGTAGDLGQANFGGAVHFFSGNPTDGFNLTQKLTYGSFDTISAVTTLNTGEINWLNGAKLLLNFDERNSNGELSYSGGEAQNQLAKFVMPINNNWTLTVFGSHNYTRFYQADAGSGETWQQVEAYGKNFALTNNPNDEHYYKYNYQSKQTDFEYARIQGQLTPSVTLDNQLYTYFYSNKTWATNSITDMLPVPGTALSKNNLTSQINNPTGTEVAGDIGGYDKLNMYRVVGDTLRLNKDFSFGDLKVGAQVEHATTDRFNELEDFTAGSWNELGDFPDDKFTTKKYAVPANTNAKTLENSAYLTWQVFGDFDWNVTDALKISPGFKFIHSYINVNAADENVAVASTTPNASAYKNTALVAANSYSSPLYFLTANYKIKPDWSVYGQVATSFLLPGLPNLYYQAANIQQLQPERTITYQAGTVYSHGNFTADADAYLIAASDLQVPCTVDSEASTCNEGNARYTGVEGEVAYAFDQGFTLFANGALITAKQLANAANPGAGIAANPAEELANAPRWTDAAGVLYHQGPMRATLTFKQSGAYDAINGGDLLPGYNTLDASFSYDFGRFGIKLQAFNLADNRAITNFTGTALYSTTDLGLYTFQAGRELSATLIAKF